MAGDVARGGVRIYPPAEERQLEDAVYNMRSLKGPRLAGIVFRIFLAIVTPFMWLVAPPLKTDSGIPQVLDEVEVPEAPTFEPIWPPGSAVDEPATASLDSTMSPQDKVKVAVSGLHPIRDPAPGFRYASIRDFARAYERGWTTPTKVAKRILEFVRESENQTPPMRYFIAFDTADVLKQAEISTARYLEGKPLGILDGVPFAIKDEVDVVPYKTTAGTCFLQDERAVTNDATVVARLRSAGALALGKTNMIEVGMGVIGGNLHHGIPRNPHNPDYYCGGSSSASAAVVGAGICPFAIGCDGGGSIRIPSSFCGAVGLKATFGRISEKGCVPLCYTVAHCGPIGASVEDVLLSYAAMAGVDPGYAPSLNQPPVRIPHLDATTVMTEVEGVKVGVWDEWFDDCEADVNKICRDALEDLQREYGTQLEAIKIPELEEMRVAHVTTIISEMAQYFSPAIKRGHWNDFSPEMRLNILIANTFTNRDYILAQKLRTRQINFHKRVFERVDVIAVPTAGRTAPIIRPDVFSAGESDLTCTSRIMKFVQSGNFVGLPAISVHVGHNEDGLPVGLQLIGRPWGEASLLRVAAAVEAVTAGKRQAPVVYCNLLSLLQESSSSA